MHVLRSDLVQCVCVKNRFRAVCVLRTQLVIECSAYIKNRFSAVHVLRTELVQCLCVLRTDLEQCMC